MNKQNEKARRAEQARINGAKSTGAVTPEGQLKAKTASLQHGIYAQDDVLAATADPVKFEALRQEFHALWQPINTYVARRVDVLVKLTWRLDTFVAFRQQVMNELYDNSANLTHLYTKAIEEKGIVERLDAKIQQCNREISRLERDIERTQKMFKREGASHKPMQTQEAPQATRDTAPPPPPCNRENPEPAPPTPAQPANFTPSEPPNATPDTAPRT